MKSYNIFSAIGLIVGGLSWSQRLTFIGGLLVMISVIIVNVYGILTKRAEKKKNEAQQKLAEEQLKQLNDE